MMQQPDANDLLKKYRDGTATEAEKALLGDWILFGKLNERSLTDEELAHDLALIEKGLPLPKQTRPIGWPRVAVAAAVLLFVAIGLYFVWPKKPAQQIVQNPKQDVAPALNQATLTLANGKKIVLTQGLSGTLAQQGNVLVSVNTQNAIAYTPSVTNANAPVEYNTLSTAKGEQSPFALILADGSKIWLNAESSVTFPTSFKGNGRVIKITGEAYLEVVHNSAKPFKVLVRDQTIQDLGTHFNINAYDNEPVIKTTLLEGSIRVANGSKTVVIKPGQQAITRYRQDVIDIKNADVDETMAWKTGYFRFNNEKIESVMRQLSRWYNIEVQYDGKATDEGFYGKVSRYKNISAVLKMLEQTKGVHFKIEGRRITVVQ